MKEIWRDIESYEGLYQVSNLGNIRRFKAGRYVSVKPWSTGNGYKMVSLSKDGVRKVALVHRIVALNFINNSNGYSQVNHINEVKSDNRAENLEFMTAKMNTNYGTGRTRCIESRMKKHKFIYQQLDEGGNIVAEYRGKSDFTIHGFLPKYVYPACKANKPYKGFYWKRIANTKTEEK